MADAGRTPLRHWRWWWRWLHALWPQVPLAAVLAGSGALNVLSGFRYPVLRFAPLGPLAGVGQSLSALGSGAQIILGIGLVLVGVGLLWRLSTAWAFAVLLLAITVGVNALRSQWGPSLLLPLVLLVALFALRRHFSRRTVLATYLMSFTGILAVLAYGSFGSYLLGASFRPPIGDLATAFYFTIVTLSTVGYGDITPADPDTRLFTVSLLLVGLSVFATAIAAALGPAISGELARIFRPHGGDMKPAEHVILVGEGSIASAAARELAARGVVFVHVVAPGRRSPAPDELVLEADARDDAALERAGIERARLVVAAREDEGENAFVTLAAKALNPEVRVLAVANAEASIRRLQLARADRVFAPAAAGGRLLADLAEGRELAPGFRDLLGDPDPAA